MDFTNTYGTNVQSAKCSPNLRCDGRDDVSKLSINSLSEFSHIDATCDSAKQKHAILGEVTETGTIQRVCLSDGTHIASKKVPICDRISLCKSLESESSDSESLNSLEEVEGKSVCCKNDCTTKDSTSSGSDTETKSFAGSSDSESYDIHELYDEDYQWEADGLEEEEVKDERRSDRAAVPWSLDRCGSFSSLSGTGEDPPDTTDPYLSHKLIIPYSRILRPRQFHHVTNKYVTTSLPRRIRSPVRKTLPGKFDLPAAYEEWQRKQRLMDTRRSVRESKDRITESIKQLSLDKLKGDKLISSLVLEALLEEVVLTSMSVKIIVDVRTVVEMAMILALAELNILDGNFLTAEQSKLFIDSGIMAHHESEDTGINQMRKNLLGAYRAPLNRRIHTAFHRRLPWPYISPCHHRGYTKFYPNVRERIDEQEPTANDQNLSSYVPDLRCFHLKEVLDQSYVGYKRQSKYQSSEMDDIDMFETFCLQLLSFM